MAIANTHTLDWIVFFFHFHLFNLDCKFNNFAVLLTIFSVAVVVAFVEDCVIARGSPALFFLLFICLPVLLRHTFSVLTVLGCVT